MVGRGANMCRGDRRAGSVRDIDRELLRGRELESQLDVVDPRIDG